MKNTGIVLELLKKYFPEAEVIVSNPRGDDDHLAAHIISPRFQGKTMVECHRLVYEALGDLVGGQVHALSIKTSVPS